MTWKVRTDGLIEKLTKHNWQVQGGDKLICLTGPHPSNVTCVGCGSIVSGSEIIEVFGPPGDGGGLVAADMADGIAAGMFVDEVAITSH